VDSTEFVDLFGLHVKFYMLQCFSVYRSQVGG